MDETVDPLSNLRALFAKSRGKFGDLDNPSIDGLVEIARHGHRTWNSWRKAYPKPQADFRGYDFTQHPVDFCHFHFPSTNHHHACANFNGAKFDERTKFRHATFGTDASFIDIEFVSGRADFSGASFGDRANFTIAKFGITPTFENCVFGEFATFTDCSFGYRTVFKKTTFGNSTCFYGTYFDEIAEFTECEFGNLTDFRQTTFNGQSLFDRTNFSGYVYFTDAIFGDATIFDKCRIGGCSNFDDTTFGTSTKITNCKFENYASFLNTRFGTSCEFKNTEFGDQTDFSQSIFSGKTCFTQTRFGKWTSFANTSFSGPALFDLAKFNGDVDFSFSREIKSRVEDNSTKPFAKYSEAKNKSRNSPENFAHEDFQDISFCGCIFSKDVRFSGRKFTSKTNFGPKRDACAPGGNQTHEIPTVFMGAAEFHGCDFSQDTSFEKAQFTVRNEQKFVHAFRSLKGIMRSLNAVQEEQMFFRLEIEAEHEMHSRGRQALYSIYKACSYYGASIHRPILIMMISSAIFAASYGGLANWRTGNLLATDSSEINWERTTEWFRYLTINTIPVPGFDKTQAQLRDSLYGNAFAHQDERRRNVEAVILTLAMSLEIAHKLISLGCAFLLGLALRNLFKMKS